RRARGALASRVGAALAPARALADRAGAPRRARHQRRAGRRSSRVRARARRPARVLRAGAGRVRGRAGGAAPGPRGPAVLLLRGGRGGAGGPGAVSARGCPGRVGADRPAGPRAPGPRARGVTATPRDVLARNTVWYGLITVLGLASGLAMSVVLARG